MVAEALGRAVPPLSPPAGLRARVLASAVPSVTPRATYSRTTWLAAAALLVAAVMTAVAWHYRGEASRARADQQATARALTALEQQVATLQANAATATQTRSVLSARDLARIDLSGQEPAPGATGRVFWSPTHGLVFAATNLPALPPGRVYQLWVVAESPVSAGIAEPGASGELSVVTKPATSAPPKAFALTIEPEGGRPAPTGPMYLLGAM